MKRRPIALFVLAFLVIGVAVFVVRGRSAVLYSSAIEPRAWAQAEWDRTFAPPPADPLPAPPTITGLSVDGGKAGEVTVRYDTIARLGF